MLVLSRKKNETIQIGQDIVVRVVEFKGNRVRLAIEAPDNVTILRGELVSEFSDPATPSWNDSDYSPASFSPCCK